MTLSLSYDILSFENGGEGLLYELKNGMMTYRFTEIGAELISAKDKEGFEYIWKGDESIWSSHSPLLFPICGRVKSGKYTYQGKEYALGCHGFFHSSSPELIFRDETTLIFTLTESQSTLEVYPFRFSITLKYTAEGNALTVSAVIKNTGSDVLPFMYGGHPGFALPLEAGLKFNDHSIDLGNDTLTLHKLCGGPFVGSCESFYAKGGILPLDAEMIKELDTVIFSDFGKSVRLFSDRSERSVSMSFGEEFEYLCLWRADHKDADYICIEPWSGVPKDGVSDECFETKADMIRLNSGEEKIFTYRMQFN